MSVIPSLGTPQPPCLILKCLKGARASFSPSAPDQQLLQESSVFKRPLEEYTRHLLSHFLGLGAAGVRWRDDPEIRGWNRHETRQQARPTLDGLPTLKSELQTNTGSHLSQSPKCLGGNLPVLKPTQWHPPATCSRGPLLWKLQPPQNQGT